MKAFLTIFLALAISSTAIAADPVHSIPASGIELYVTDTVEEVEVEGDFLRFYLTDSGIFATGFVFKDTQNEYPQLKAFADQFLDTYFASSENRVFSEIAVQSDFTNKMITGREYLIDAESGTCELLLAHAVGDRTYMFFNITHVRGPTRCVDVARELQSAVRSIAASIVINGT